MGGIVFPLDSFTKKLTKKIRTKQIVCKVSIELQERHPEFQPGTHGYDYLIHWQKQIDNPPEAKRINEEVIPSELRVKYPDFKPGTDEWAYLEFCARWKDDFVGLVEHIFKIKLSGQQKRLLRAICTPDARVSVRSAHGTGKSYSSALIALCFMITRPFARVICTSGSMATLRSVLMPEVSMLFDEISLILPIFRQWFELQADGIKHIFRPESYLKCRTARKESPQNIAGQHVKANDPEFIDYASPFGLLWIVEEASSLANDPEIFEVIESSLTTGQENKLLLIGNPTANYGYHYESHHKNKDKFIFLHFSAYDSPFVSKKQIQDFIDKYGRTSAEFIVRILGEFCHDSDEFLMSRPVIEDCRDTPLNPRAMLDLTDAKDIISVDLGKGTGRDKSIIVHAQVELHEGQVQGINVIGKIYKSSDTEILDIIDMAIEKSRDLGNCPIIYDGHGVGAAVHKYMEKANANAYEFISGRRAQQKNRFANLRASGYGMLKRLTESRGLWFRDDEQLILQLCQIPFKRDEKNRLQIMTKPDMKKKFSLPSPDESDALSQLVMAPQCKFDVDYDDSKIDYSIAPIGDMYD